MQAEAKPAERGLGASLQPEIPHDKNNSITILKILITREP